MKWNRNNRETERRPVGTKTPNDTVITCEKEKRESEREREEKKNLSWPRKITQNAQNLQSTDLSFITKLYFEVFSWDKNV